MCVGLSCEVGFPSALVDADRFSSSKRPSRVAKRNKRVTSHFRKIFKGFTDSFTSEQNHSNIFMPTIHCPLRASGNAWSAMTESHATSSNELNAGYRGEEVAFVILLHFFSPLDIVIATHRSSSKGKFVKPSCSFFFHARTNSKFLPLCVEVWLKKSGVG